MRHAELQVNDGVAELRLDKPRALNALCAAMAGELLATLGALADDPQVRALLLTGNGRAFCAGSDLGAPVPVPDLSSAERGDLLLREYFNPLIRALRTFPKPVVCGVNGIAVGGGVGLALSGDLTIAAASAEFRLSFGPRLGLVPDMGCTWWLPRGVGRARALGTVLTGAPVSAETARDWGLIWDVVPDDGFPEAARAAARRLADGPAAAFVAARTLMDDGLQRGLDEQLEREREVQTALMGGPDFAEGVAAFKEKREPRFSPTPRDGAPDGR